MYSVGLTQGMAVSLEVESKKSIALQNVCSSFSKWLFCGDYLQVCSNSLCNVLKSGQIPYHYVPVQ